MLTWVRRFVVIAVMINCAECKVLDEVITTYTDPFLPNLPGGRPTFGSASATCWARGGICTDIQYCIDMSFDPSIPGCNTGFKVCCKNYKRFPPTVGTQRKSGEVLIFSSDFHELNEAMVRFLALINANLLKEL